MTICQSGAVRTSSLPSGSTAADSLLRVANVLEVVEESRGVEVDHIQWTSALVGYYLT